MSVTSLVANAVQWHLRWRGTPCTLPPTKGRRTELPPDEPFRPSQRLPGEPFRRRESFRIKVESEETRQSTKREIIVCIPVVGFLQTKNDIIQTCNHWKKKEHEQW